MDKLFFKDFKIGVLVLLVLLASLILGTIYLTKFNSPNIEKTQIELDNNYRFISAVEGAAYSRIGRL